MSGVCSGEDLILDHVIAELGNLFFRSSTFELRSISFAQSVLTSHRLDIKRTSAQSVHSERISPQNFQRKCTAVVVLQLDHSYSNALSSSTDISVTVNSRYGKANQRVISSLGGEMYWHNFQLLWKLMEESSGEQYTPHQIARNFDHFAATTNNYGMKVSLSKWSRSFRISLGR